MATPVLAFVIRQPIGTETLPERNRHDREPSASGHSVQDSGEGIPEESLEKIFEPLFTTKKGGTGLGLANCKQILENQEASITVKNNPTTFTIEFPKYSEE